jgi:hypothetical protein
LHPFWASVAPLDFSGPPASRSSRVPELKFLKNS